MRIPIHPKVSSVQALDIAARLGASLAYRCNTGQPTAMELPVEDQPCPVVQMDARRMPWTGPITPDDGPFGGDAA